MMMFLIQQFLLLLLVAVVVPHLFSSPTTTAATALLLQQPPQRPRPKLPRIKAAVLVPGFLTGADEFKPLAQELTERGVPTLVVPMPAWHWLPCLGGRSVRPVLERIDCAVRWMAAHAAAGDADNDFLLLKQANNNNNAQNKKPPHLFEYSLADAFEDFRSNPGGLYKVGGTDQVDEYPAVTPRGTFYEPTADPVGQIALIGHSAGGWISRIYLSNREYGGRAYGGQDLVHSLVTLGTPHATAPGFAFEGISWCNQEPAPLPLRQLAIGGTGFSGSGEWGKFTTNAYAFCCENASDGTRLDGDGVTPIGSALALPGADQLKLDRVHHYCWADVFGGSFVAPELTHDHKNGGLWYGSEPALDQWAGWLDV